MELPGDAVVDSISGPDQASSQRPPAPVTAAKPISVPVPDTADPGPSPPPAVQSPAPPPPTMQPPVPKSRSWRRPVGIALIAASLLAGGIFAATHTNTSKAALQQDATQRFNPQSASLSALAGRLNPSTAQSQLTVNGQFNLNGQMVLQPSTQPATPVAGTLYFDQQSDQLRYYNGSGFVSLGGGGNTFVTNNIAGPTTNVTNITNAASSGGGVNAPSGTAGHIAMFTAADTLGDSLLSQSGTTLSTAATTLQGNDSSGLSVLTANNAGATGALTLQSGDSSTTSSGTVTLDTGSGVVNGTVIQNFTFESGITGWNGAPYGSAITQTNAAAHGGTFSLAVPLTATSWSSADAGGITVIPGHEYRWTSWVRADTASAPVVTSVYFRSLGYTGPATTTNDTTGGWTQISGVFINPTGNTLVDLAYVYQKNAVETHYIDDVTLTDLSSFTGLNVNVGTTNAQAVNIGNSAQAGDTILTGGATGVKIRDTTGDITASSGGSIGLTAGTDSNFSTNGNLLLQGGAAGVLSTGGVTINTTPQSGVSGNITIQSGASSTTASGNVTVDAGAGVVSGTQIDNKTFDDGNSDFCGTGNDDMGAWFNGTTALSSAQAHSGTNSMAFTQNGPGNWAVIQDDNCAGEPIVAGHHYFFSAWFRGSVVQNVSVTLNWNGFGGQTSFASGSDTTTGWTQISGTAIAPAGTTTAFFTLGGCCENPGDIQYIDDITLTDLSSSSAISKLNLGATNAQQVSLGNLNEIGATTIQGGSGINLDSGVAGTTLNAGAFSITGATASTVQTTAGSLTVQGVDNSSWGLAAEGSGSGGNLTIHAGGGAPGVNNGGNLVLQPGYGTGSASDGSILLGQDSSPRPLTVRGGAATGSNIIGSNLTFDASNGTGVGGSGDFVFRTAGGVSNPLVTLDATTGDAEFAAGNNAPLTWTHTTGAQSDRIMIVNVGFEAAITPVTGPQATATSVTYNGVPLTQLTSVIPTNGEASGSVWYLVNPPSGSFNVSATFSGPASGIGIEATTFYNVDQTNPIANFIGNDTFNGNTISTSLVGTDAGQGVFDALMSRPDLSSIIPGAGQTEIYNQAPGGVADHGSFRQGQPGATTMSWSGTGSSTLVQVVMALNPEPNLTPDTLTEALRITQGQTLGVNLNTGENALSTISFGGSADRSIGVNQNPAAGAGHNLTLQAGGGAVGDNNGGNLILQSGTATGTGTGGSVIVKPQTDSATAFQVQNAAGTPLLTESTSQARLTLSGGNLTIDGVANPAAPTLATAGGGSLAAGTYYYMLAASSADGSTTTAVHSSPSSVVTAANGTNNLSWTNVPYNAGYLLYQSTDAGATWLVRALAANTTSYSDTSSAGWLLCGGANPTCPDNFNDASGIHLQTGAPVVFDSGNGSADVKVGYIANSNYLVEGNYNPGGGVFVEGDNYDFRDTTAYHDDFTINNSGQAAFSNRTDSAAAFQVQNATGTPLLTADTSAMTITVKALVVSTNLTIDGHVITGGSTPGIAAGAAACTSPTVAISGTDTAGTISITTGTSCPPGGILATVTFATAFAAAPHVVVSPGNSAAAGLSAYTDNSTVSTTTFDLSTANTPAATTNYQFNYWTAQ